VAYRIASFPVTLSDFQGHVPIAGLLKCKFSYTHAEGDKISTDIAHFTDLCDIGASF